MTGRRTGTEFQVRGNISHECDACSRKRKKVAGWSVEERETEKDREAERERQGAVSDSME